MTATLSALGIIGGIVGTVWARKGSTTPDEAPPAPTPLAPSGFPQTQPMTAATSAASAADGQLELAKILVAEVQREREGLQARLETTEKRLDEAEAEVEALKMRVSELAGINAQLRFLLDSRGFPTPPTLGPPAQ